jgi:TonB family protein
MAEVHQDIEYLVDDLSEKDEPEITKDDPIDQPDDSQQSSPTIDAQASPTQEIKTSENTDKKFDAQVGLDDLGYKFGDDMPFVEEMEGEIFEWVDLDAEFVGGYSEMQNYINGEVKYPEDAIEMGEQGSVFISFVVEPNGKVTNVFVEKGVYKSLDREAKRVVRSFPKWVPAELNAKKVRTRVRLPVVFVLAGE